MNIVIADDEEIILKWLKKNIEALSLANHVVETCTNGKQVLNCCLNQQVDVLFTDIRMPVMDGMELLKRLHDNHSLPYTIILSAYDDFSYARDCFKLGVAEFLLKSEITREELEKCLQAASEKIENRENREVRKESRREVMEKILRQFFQEGEFALEDSLQKTWKSSCEIRGDYTVCILYNEEKNLREEQLKEIVSFLFLEEKRIFYWIPKSESKIIILIETINEKLEKFVKRVYHALASFGGGQIYVSAGEAGEGIRSLQELYQHAEETLAYQTFYGKTGGADYESIKRIQDRADRELEKQFQVLDEAVNSRTWNKVQKEIQALFLLIKESMPGVLSIRKLLLNFLFNIYWNLMDEEAKKNISIDRLIAASNCADINKLEKTVSKQIEELMEIFISRNRNYSEAVYMVIRYIEKNYSKPVTLEELANYVHMNRSYISHLFKKETGNNINTYLLEVRLEKAKLMLQNSKNSIQDICSEVGIYDSAYFSKVFKKHMGVSPLEFRRIYSEK